MMNHNTRTSKKKKKKRAKQKCLVCLRLHAFSTRPSAHTYTHTRLGLISYIKDNTSKVNRLLKREREREIERETRRRCENVYASLPAVRLPSLPRAELTACCLPYSLRSRSGSPGLPPTALRLASRSTSGVSASSPCPAAPVASRRSPTAS